MMRPLTAAERARPRRRGLLRQADSASRVVERIERLAAGLSDVASAPPTPSRAPAERPTFVAAATPSPCWAHRRAVTRPSSMTSSSSLSRVRRQGCDHRRARAASGADCRGLLPTVEVIPTTFCPRHPSRSTFCWSARPARSRERSPDEVYLPVLSARRAARSVCREPRPLRRRGRALQARAVSTQRTAPSAHSHVHTYGMGHFLSAALGHDGIPRTQPLLPAARALELIEQERATVFPFALLS